MADGDVARIVGVAPVVLGIEHHALGPGILGGPGGGGEVDIEMLLRWGVEFPLHHPVSSLGWDNAGTFVLGAGAGQVGIV